MENIWHGWRVNKWTGKCFWRNYPNATEIDEVIESVKEKLRDMDHGRKRFNI